VGEVVYGFCAWGTWGGQGSVSVPIAVAFWLFVIKEFYFFFYSWLVMKSWYF